MPVERITVHPGGDLECLCGNEAPYEGFEVCLPDGTVTTPDAAGPWDGIHVVCLRCGRVVNQDTGEVTGRRDPDAVAAEATAVWEEEWANG